MIKYSFIALLALTSSLVVPQVANAQTETRQVQISGDVTNYYDALVPYDVATYQLVLSIDENAVPSSSSPTQIRYGNTSPFLLSATLVFFDPEGQEVSLPNELYVSSTNYYQLDLISNGEQDRFTGYLGDTAADIYFNISGISGSIFSSFGTQPEFVAAPENVNASLHFYTNTGPTGYFHDDPYGSVTSILDVVADIDLDGIADNIDTCPTSVLDETVMFDGWLNSGVTNYVDESGCSIMDHYAACEAEEEEQPSSPWGWFQPVSSGPSYCETQVVYGLQSDGVIDHMEGRMLRNALRLSYDSDVPR